MKIISINLLLSILLYKNQNNTLNDIFHNFQNLILTTNINHDNIHKENYKKVREKIKSSIIFDEGTYDLVYLNNVIYVIGYSVIFETPSFRENVDPGKNVYPDGYIISVKWIHKFF